MLIFVGFRSGGSKSNGLFRASYLKDAKRLGELPSWLVFEVIKTVLQKVVLRTHPGKNRSDCHVLAKFKYGADIPRSFFV